MTKPLSEQSPLEIDTALAALWEDRYRAEHALRLARENVMSVSSAKRTYGRGGGGWSMSYGDAKAEVEATAGSESAFAWDRQSAERAIDAVNKAAEKVVGIKGEIAVLNDEFQRRGGWTRAYLVTDGHVHSSMNCSTCHNGQYMTQFTWLVEFADHTEAHIVAAAAERACTVCYPSAPVETAGPSSLMTPDERTRAEAREEAAKAKAERIAKKIANGLTEDGSEFVVSHPGFHEGRTETHRFKTERAAVQWMVQYMVWGAHGHTDYTPAFEAIIEAVADKHGKSTEQVRAEVAEKVKAKRKRDGM